MRKLVDRLADAHVDDRCAARRPSTWLFPLNWTELIWRCSVTMEGRDDHRRSASVSTFASTLENLRRPVKCACG